MIKWLFPALLALCGSSAARSEPELRFSIEEGRIDNHFYRDGPIAAHLLTKSGENARLVIAFPAGNSGVALWLDQPVNWRMLTPLDPAAAALDDGAVRRGVSARFEIDAARVAIRRALTGSVRVLRDYGYGNPIPAQVETAPQITGNQVVWQRRRLDGGPGYALTLTVENGRVGRSGDAITLESDDPVLRLRVTGLSGDEPLTPLASQEIFADGSGDPRLRRALTFLAYREKLLAGSWQYDTYFGRDTLMTLALTMRQLQAAPVEAGLGSVIERLDPAGEVAHEEGIGEFPLIAGEPGPMLDYHMVDDDFMLAPVAATWLLDTSEGRARAAQFLARRTASGQSYGQRLLDNLTQVIARAQPFATEPGFARLVALHEGSKVGDWRDSQLGLGGDSRYSFSINAALVPAALHAAARLGQSGLLDSYGPGAAALADAAELTEVWAREAPLLFRVTREQGEASRQIAAYADALQLAPIDSGSGEEVGFLALGLDQAGRPLEVMHSDVGFLLFFDRPDDRLIELALRQAMRPFPAGLMSEVGMMVANPALAGSERWELFDRTRYHGTVVWSWQHELLRAGIACQLRRSDIAPATRSLLVDAGQKIEQAIADHRTLQGSELWSWEPQAGRLVAVPYGQAQGHETESNSVQLWSATSLGGEPVCPAAQSSVASR